MEEIAAETNSSVSDVFIKYMDLASEATVATQKKFQSTVGNMTKYRIKCCKTERIFGDINKTRKLKQGMMQQLLTGKIRLV